MDPDIHQARLMRERAAKLQAENRMMLQLLRQAINARFQLIQEQHTLRRQLRQLYYRGIPPSKPTG